MSRYKGRVNKITHRYGQAGFIAIESVTFPDGSPSFLKSTQDIFVFMTEDEPALRLGMELEFAVDKDAKRGGDALKAWAVVETVESRVVALGQGGIDLTIQGEKDGSIEQASVFATWRLSDEVIERVKRSRLAGVPVHLVIVHWSLDRDFGKHDETTETRKVMDITDPLVYLTFSRSGTHRVIALAMQDSPRARDLSDTLLKKRDGVYKTTLIGENGVRVVADYEVLGTGCNELYMPPGPLAERPKDWQWVNRFFKESPVDECWYRGRRMFAYTIQPVLLSLAWIWKNVIVNLLAWSAAAIFVIVFSLTFMFAFDFKEFRRSRNPLDLVDDDDFERHFTSKKSGRPSFFWVVFTPLAFGIVALLTWAVESILPPSPRNGAWSWETFFTFYGMLILGWTYLWVKVQKKSINESAQEKERKSEAERKALEAAVANELSLLASPGRKRDQVSVWDLPLRPKYVSFFFLGAKQLVCRPFEK